MKIMFLSLVVMCSGIHSSYPMRLPMMSLDGGGGAMRDTVHLVSLIAQDDADGVYAYLKKPGQLSALGLQLTVDGIEIPLLHYAAYKGALNVMKMFVETLGYSPCHRFRYNFLRIKNRNLRSSLNDRVIYCQSISLIDLAETGSHSPLVQYLKEKGARESGEINRDFSVKN